MLKRHRARRMACGFTLLESILALAIASILLAGLAPLLTRANSRSREQETGAKMRAIKQAIAGNAELGTPGFIATMGRLPQPLDELLVAGVVPGRFGPGGVPMGWVGPYLTIGTPDPLRDAWARSYQLEPVPLCGSGGGWRLRSLGPDGSRSAADDLVIPPQGCFLSTGILRLEILRDAGGALSSPVGALSVTVYYPDPVDGHETPLLGTAAGNAVAFTCAGLDCQIPLGTHAVSVQLKGATTVFWRNVVMAAAVTNASLAFPFPAAPP